jgi:hypothetical protein
VVITTVKSNRRHLRHLREAVVARGFVALVAGALTAAVFTLMWVANRAFAGWRRTTAVLAERRAEERRRC